jgi:hypothetical protein
LDYVEEGVRVQVVGIVGIEGIEAWVEVQDVAIDSILGCCPIVELLALVQALVVAWPMVGVLGCFVLVLGLVLVLAAILVHSILVQALAEVVVLAAILVHSILAQEWVLAQA